MQFAGTRLQKPKELCWQQLTPAPKVDLSDESRKSRILKPLYRNSKRKMKGAKKEKIKQKLIAENFSQFIRCKLNLWKRSFRARCLSKTES
jgi:hypothetical protein